MAQTLQGPQVLPNTLYNVMQPIRALGGQALPIDPATQNSVRNLMMLALAVRLRLCAAASFVQISNNLRALVNQLNVRGDSNQLNVRGDTIAGNFKVIATHVNHLSDVSKSVYHDNNPPDQCSGQGAVFNANLTAAWTMLGQSRFCAEPKAFGFIRSANSDGQAVNLANARLIGQTCFWWTYAGGPPNPATYQVIGPQGNQANAALAGSYMWPCPSCRNRSGQMVAGLPSGPVLAGNVGRSHEI